MDAQKHARIIGILSYVFSGIQGVTFLALGGYVVFALVMMAVTFGNVAPVQLIGAAVVILLITLVAGAGLISSIFNLRMGLRLRGTGRASRKLVIVTSVINIFSFLTGAIVILPFAVALGIYGIVLAFSDSGKVFLGGSGRFEHPTPAMNGSV